MPLKPYRSIPIRECGEALVAIPRGEIALAEPHPYMALGAPYGAEGPWMLRESIVESLLKTQRRLQKLRPGWKILLTDAFRPNEVQVFGFNRELALQAKAMGLSPDNLSPSEHEKLIEKVCRVWAFPSDDPAMPPPHSTGAAFDCTLMDENGREVDMGSPIDENSDRSMPDYFAAALDDVGKLAHAHRVLLNDVLLTEGFIRAPSEWWHFSRGDQLAVWINREKEPEGVAIYGRVKVSLAAS
ncbi:MAG: M15 family metallopeptidase [Alphaproteobacteria bacterium]|nr:M15 family metallopeptidase [Alphaproteobacteria bacterium]